MSVDNRGELRLPWRKAFGMARRRHANREIEGALRHAEMYGWRVEVSAGHAHAWGRMYCPNPDSQCREGEFCIVSIWSTPRSPVDHARWIRRTVDGCTRRETGTDHA